MSSAIQTLDRRLLRLPEVRQRVGLSRSEIYRRIRRNEFPKAISLGPKTSAWDASELDRWIADRIAARDGRVSK